MTAPNLTARQKQYLKGLAHPMNVLVQIGKEGLSPRIIETVNNELMHHELIKVKIGNNSGLEKHGTAETLASDSHSVLVQLIGKVVVLYRPNPERPREKRIVLPKR
ncbi:MAG: ribosome assembly RNA-binding protein YhbY [Desulforhopalus sp.]